MSRRWVYLWLFTCLLIVGVTMGASLAALDNAAGYYSFDDDNLTGSDPRDLSGNGRTGTSVSITTGIQGVLEEAFNYTGSGRVTTPQMISSTGSKSVAFWVNASDYTPASQQVLYSTGAVPEGTLYIYIADIAGAGRVGLTQRNAADSAWQDALWDANFSDGTAHHVVYTWDGTNARLYLDGTNVDTGFGWSLGNRATWGSSREIGARALASPDQNLVGSIDEWGHWNYTLSTSQVAALYNAGAGFNPYKNVTPSNTTFFTITATDSYTGGAITNFTALVNGTNYTTTNGSIVTTINQTLNYSVNVTLGSNESGGYFSRSYNDYNTSSNLVASIHQARSVFYAYNVVNGDNVSSFTATTSSNGGSATVTATNPQLNTSAGNDFLFTFKKNGYYWSTLTQDVAARSVTNRNFSVYDHKLNVSITVLAGSTTDQNFTAVVSGLGSLSGFSRTISTTNGSAVFNLTHGNYTVEINDSIHQYVSENVTLSSSQNWTNLDISIYGTNTILFRFFDEESGLLMNGSLVTFFLTSNVTSYNFSTSNGSYYAELLSPLQYVITYTSSGYSQREYVFSLANQTYNEIDLWLIPDSQSSLVTLTLVDEVAVRLSDTVVSVQKRNLSGTNYYVVQECTTNDNGQCALLLELYNTTYRFTARTLAGSSYRFVSTGAFTSTAQAIISTDLQLSVITGIDTVEAVVNEYLTLSGDVYWVNSSSTFFFTYSNPDNLGTNMCLSVTRSGASSPYTISCSSLSTDTLSVVVNTSTSSGFVARGYWVPSSGSELTIDVYELLVGTIADSLGSFGLYVFGFLLAGVAAFGSLWSPVIAPVVLFVSLLSAGVLGFINVGWTLLGVVGSLVVIVVMLVKR